MKIFELTIREFMHEPRRKLYASYEAAKAQMLQASNGRVERSFNLEATATKGQNGEVWKIEVLDGTCNTVGVYSIEPRTVHTA